jgi:PPM family protein phosphatase
MSLSVQVYGRSDIGCVRTNNEDNLGFDKRYGIYVVCDGMGGQAAGEVASKMAVDSILNYFRAAGKGPYPEIGPKIADATEMGNALASAIQLANSNIYEAASNDSGHAGMGSTIVGVLLRDNFCSVANVGDSRVYLVREGNIKQLTDDHSLVMEQVRRGLITREEAEASEMQNIIIRALGSEETVEVDVHDMMAAPGDIFMLATDGLTKHIKDARILEMILTAKDLKGACEALIQAAKDDGGDDNITCILLRVEERPWYKKFFSFGSGGGPEWQNSI